MRIGELLLDVEGFLGRLREDSQSPEEQEKFMVAIDALRFISATGQAYDLEDYRKRLDTNAPPLVIATFDTPEEADRWLKNHPNLPHHGYVLIAGEYHTLLYGRESNIRKLFRGQTLEYYLGEMIRDGLPAPVATFDTREEADVWLNSQPEPPRQVFVTIAGEYYLAVYHDRVNVRALYPVSRAAKSEQP